MGGEREGGAGESEREREGGGGGERESVCVCVCERERVCVCLCVRERERVGGLIPTLIICHSHLFSVGWPKASVVSLTVREVDMIFIQVAPT